MRERSAPGLRLALVGLGVLALLALVSLASRGGLGGGGSGAGPSQGVLDWAFSIFLVVYVASIPFAIWFYVVQRRNEEQRRGRKRGRWLVNLLVFLAFLAVALGITRLHGVHGKSIHLNTILSAANGKKPPANGRRPARSASPRFEWPVLVAAAAVVAGAAGAFVVARRRREQPRAPLVAAELGLALDDAIDDVRAETDPRRAVIKAYARMESVLAAHGLPRRPAEAPYEYLGRTLRELEASAGSVGRLTDLFARAKFSLHEIDASMRADAIDALTAVRDELRA